MIYLHNPKCSKSRAGLELLAKSGHKVEIREYLKNPLSEPEWMALLGKFNGVTKELVRCKDKAFVKLKIDPEDMSDTDCVALLVAHPNLMERPILMSESWAVMGRPSERLLTYL